MRNLMIKDLDFNDKSLLSLLDELRPKKIFSITPNRCWSYEETTILYNLTCKYGQNWKLISSHFQNKKPKDCRSHWFENFAKKVPIFKTQARPVKNTKKQPKLNNVNLVTTKNTILAKSDSSNSNEGRSSIADKSKSLRIVLPIMNSGEINSIKPSQILIKKLIDSIYS